MYYDIKHYCLALLAKKIKIMIIFPALKEKETIDFHCSLVFILE